jgi:hypothetical protein
MQIKMRWRGGDERIIKLYKLMRAESGWRDSDSFTASVTQASPMEKLLLLG